MSLSNPFHIYYTMNIFYSNMTQHFHRQTCSIINTHTYKHTQKHKHTHKDSYKHFTAQQFVSTGLGLVWVQPNSYNKDYLVYSPCTVLVLSLYCPCTVLFQSNFSWFVYCTCPNFLNVGPVLQMKRSLKCICMQWLYLEYAWILGLQAKSLGLGNKVQEIILYEIQHIQDISRSRISIFRIYLGLGYLD